MDFSPGFELHRPKRDLTCASGGHRLCSYSCKARGQRDGACAWDTETAAYDCVCDTERRGVRCNMGGPNTCHYSCVALGYQEGSCDADFNCNCGGGNNRWGNWIQDIGNRL